MTAPKVISEMAATRMSLQSVYGDLGYDDPMLVGKYFGVTVSEFEVGTAQFTRRSSLLAP